MPKHPNAFRALGDDDNGTRPMMALPNPDEGTERVEEDDSLTLSMAAMPDPDEPVQAPTTTAEQTRQMRGLVSPGSDDSTRPMRGLVDPSEAGRGDDGEP